VALVLSASTMTLSASAATTPAITPAVLYRSLGDVHTKLNRIEAKIDALTTAQGGTPGAECPTTPATTDQAPAKAITDDRAFVAPPADVTKCRQSCEDDFNACSKAAGQDQKAYAVCKSNYEDCFNKCAQ